jgi:phosphatidylserine/phosphatidylglycerophosphate/cardiolipin synthase-like enzyme
MKKIIIGILASLLICSTVGIIVNAATATPKTITTTAGTVQYYFPRAGQAPEPVLVSLISSAKTSVDMAIYSITDQNIANALIADEKRGVKVEVISDKTESGNKYQKAVLNTLKAAKIPVKINHHSGLMHLKVTIVDKSTVTTGSFNYSASAETENDEVFVVLNNTSAVSDFTTEFTTMWSDTKDYLNY